LPPPLLAMAHALVHAGIRFDASHRSGTAPDTPPRLPNHVLINEYQPADGILPHTDGPSYEPCTATLSLGGDVVLRFAPRVHRKEDPQARLTTRPTDAHAVYLSGRGSLVVFRDDAYRDYGHAIRYTDHRYAHDNDDNNNNNHDTETVPTDCYYRADHDTASESLVSALPASPIVRAYRVSLTFRFHKDGTA
jgi:alkylated DNA repair protein alkB family protein 6